MSANLPFSIREHSRNIHTVDLIGESVSDSWTFVLSSDIHWDSPHCDRDAWDRMLRQASDNRWGVFIWGDAYDLMQGRYDGRRSRHGVRPEFDHGDYLDAVIDGFADWHSERNKNGNILLITRGNHEESVRRNCDTDPIGRTVALMNRAGTTKTYAGGYGGWVRFNLHLHGNKAYSLLLKYHHGSGGAALMSHGSLAVRRHAAVQPDADVVCMGHVHRRWIIPIARERVVMNKRGASIVRDTQYHVCCGGFKNEFEDGASGWSVEKDMPPMETGAVLMRLFLEKRNEATESRACNMRYRLVPEFILPR